MYDYIDSIMLGMTISSFICVAIIGFLYFPQKRLRNASSKIFGIIIVITLINTFFDSTMYIFSVQLKTMSESVVSMCAYLYVVSGILALYLMTIYCYMMTYCKNRHLSKMFIFGSSLPCILSVIILTIWWKSHQLIIIDSQGAGISESTFGIVMVNYVVYSIINIGLMLIYRTGREYKGVFITNGLGILQGVILILVAKTQNLLIESTILMIDILLLYILVQNPINQVDMDLDCYDKKALQKMLISLESQQKDYYMLTVDVVDINYYMAKYGIEVTEMILKKLVEQLPDDNARTSKYRYENDIFVVLTTDKKEFEKATEVWKKNLKSIWHIDGNKIRVGFVVTEYFRDHNEEEDNMIIFLNKIMSFEKKQRGARYVRVEERKALIDREFQVLAAVRRAIENDDFDVYYQPIYDVSKGCFDKAEALARLYDNKLGFISPDEFIEVAENNSIIREVTKCVIRKAFRTLADPNFAKTGITSININLSSLELSDNDTFIFLRSEMKKNKLTPESITLEVTETAEVEVFSDFVNSINIIHDYGFSIALDDYGTGFSNMDRILSLPFKYIKIDKTMLNMANENQKKQIMLEKNIEMLKGCGYEIVVEGVETEEQASRLKNLNVDYIQGFYYSRPLPKDELIDKFGYKTIE